MNLVVTRVSSQVSPRSFPVIGALLFWEFAHSLCNGISFAYGGPPPLFFLFLMISELPRELVLSGWVSFFCVSGDVSALFPGGERVFFSFVAKFFRFFPL